MTFSVARVRMKAIIQGTEIMVMGGRVFTLGNYKKGLFLLFMCENSLVLYKCLTTLMALLKWLLASSLWPRLGSFLTGPQGPKLPIKQCLSTVTLHSSP